jgi:hypothetical protein
LKEKGNFERDPHLYDLAIYDGRTLLGTVGEGVCGFHAETADGRDLGRFPNVDAARAAILATRAR